MPTMLAFYMLAATMPFDAPEAPTPVQSAAPMLAVMPLLATLPMPRVTAMYNNRPGPIGWPPRNWKRRVR